LIGATVNDLASLVRIQPGSVGYIGVGPVFGTTSKAAPAPTLGLAGLGRIVSAARCPVLAVGGITPERVAEVLATGARGVAVLSGFVGARDPAARVAEYVEALAAAGAEVSRA
jgi:thiamine-phosphate pyrophosphorylase